MPPATILPDPTRLHLLGLTADATSITATVITTAATARCPLCEQLSTHVHSRYMRHPADLPWHGIAMRLVLHVRKFFCDNEACARRVFTERLPGIVAPYARRTARLDHWFAVVGFAAGGEAGARVLRELGLAATPESVLARLRAFRFPHGPTPRVLGVDDFAFRRRRRYGTILVDLERHQVVDVLPDRTADTLATWLKAHPGVEVVSRDRGGDYAVGARQGAPNAVQIADRFHLIKNLGELVERALRRHAPAVRQLTVSSHSIATAPRRPEREAVRRQVQARIQSRYEAIHTLAATGMSGQAIARALGIHWHTVARNLRLPTCPERARHPRKPNLLDPYEPYWREIVALGYPGTSQNVSRFVTYLRQHEQHEQEALRSVSGETTDGAPRCLLPSSSPFPGRRGLTPREAVGLLPRRREDLTAEQQAIRATLCRIHPEMACADTLLSRFRRVFREHDVQGLMSWIEEAEQSTLPEAQTFVTKLRQDLPAVQAAVTSPWSQGQVEGQVNRLKLFKRSMYGRAKFDLFRQRALYRTAAA